MRMLYGSLDMYSDGVMGIALPVWGCVMGSALLVDSSFIANYAFGSGGAVHVGFNAPGRPPSPPTLTIKNCDFLDNVGKNGGGHAVHYGKSSARQGQQYDNQLQLSSAG